jgi:hypothetical protein
MMVDNPKLNNLEEETRLSIRNRFRNALEFNAYGPIEAVRFVEGSKMIPAIYYGDNSLNRTIGE